MTAQTVVSLSLHWLMHLLVSSGRMSRLRENISYYCLIVEYRKWYFVLNLIYLALFSWFEKKYCNCVWKWNAFKSVPKNKLNQMHVVDVRYCWMSLLRRSKHNIRSLLFKLQNLHSRSACHDQNLTINFVCGGLFGTHLEDLCVNYHLKHVILSHLKDWSLTSALHLKELLNKGKTKH